MFSYQFHIRDYLTKTRHLTQTEDLAYRRLLDCYYTEEQPLPTEPEQCARLIAMRESVAEVTAVLKEFFDLQEDGWHNDRADAEIAKYQSFGEAGRRGAAKRWGNREANGEATSPPNPTPIATNNQQPVTKGNKRSADLFPDVSSEVLSGFVSMRRSLRAPITEIAAKGIYREAKKAGITVEQALTMCIERSWRGFKAEWVKGEEKSGTNWEAELKDAI